MTPLALILMFTTLALIIAAFLLYFFYLATDRRWMLPASAIALVLGFTTLTFQ